MKNTVLRLLHESYRKQETLEASAQNKIYVAGNSFAAFQIEITAKEDTLLMLGDCYEDRVSRPARIRLAIEAGELDFQLYAVECVNGFADPLPARRSIMLIKEQPAYIFAVARTGETVPYTVARVSLYCAHENKENFVQQAEIECVPLGFSFAKPWHYVNKIDLWQHPTCIARYYDVEEYSDAHFAILEQYVQALAWLGQKSVSIIASHTPWDGQRRALAKQGPAPNLFESQMVRITKTENRLFFDFSVIDRYIALCQAYGIDDEYEVFGLCGAWTERILLRAKENDRYIYLTDSEIDLYIEALYRHFQVKGYLAKTVICADEPNDKEHFTQDLNRIRRLAPGFCFKAALDNPTFADSFDGDLQVIVPSFFTACSRLTQLQQLSIEKTWYICCGPDRPNSFISSRLAEIRSLAYLNELFDFQGILRWAFTAWTDEPYTNGRAGMWESGDTYLIYPGKGGKPVYSLRYYQLRRMIEDLQLLQQVQNKRQYIDKIWYIQSPADITWADWKVQGEHLYSENMADYDACRLEMIQEIQEQA